jgi:hypothetical protein
MVEALHELGVEDSEIKTKIGNTYRDQYKEAYRKGDEAKMAEIEDILDNTGFDFDIDKWEEQVDESTVCNNSAQGKPWAFCNVRVMYKNAVSVDFTTWSDGSGPKGRGFESRHFDRKTSQDQRLRGFLYVP